MDIQPWRRSMITRLALASILALSILPACVVHEGGDDGGEVTPPPAAGASLAGTWLVSGACGGDLCTITQAGCSITAVSCTSGARSTSGTLDGSRFMYTGFSGGNAPSTCNG